MFDKYTPHPFHQFIPFSIIVIGAAIFGWFPGWVGGFIFAAALVIGVRTSIWIAWAG